MNLFANAVIVLVQINVAANARILASEPGSSVQTNGTEISGRFDKNGKRLRLSLVK